MSYSQRPVPVAEISMPPGATGLRGCEASDSAASCGEGTETTSDTSCADDGTRPVALLALSLQRDGDGPRCHRAASECVGTFATSNTRSAERPPLFDRESSLVVLSPLSPLSSSHRRMCSASNRSEAALGNDHRMQTRRARPSCRFFCFHAMHVPCLTLVMACDVERDRRTVGCTFPAREA